MCLLLAKWGSPPNQKQFYGWLCLFFFSLLLFLWKLPVGLKHNIVGGRKRGRVSQVDFWWVQISLQTGQALWESGAAKTRNCLRRWSFSCDHILALEPPSNPPLSLFPFFPLPPQPGSLEGEEERFATNARAGVMVPCLALLPAPACVCLFCLFLLPFFLKWNLNFPLPCLPLVSVFMVGGVRWTTPRMRFSACPCLSRVAALVFGNSLWDTWKSSW